MSTMPALFESVVPAAPSRAARLVEVGVAGKELGHGHSLLSDVIVLGRSRGCCVQLAQDGQVSRRHCELRRVGERWIVRDLGATHGVRVNGRPVAEHVLSCGDTVALGGTTLKFRASWLRCTGTDRSVQDDAGRAG